MNTNPQKQMNTLRFGNVRSLENFIELGVYITLVCNFCILFGNSQGYDVLVSWPTRLMVSYVILLGVVLCVNRLMSSRVSITDTWYVVMAVFAALCFVLNGKLSEVVSYMCFLMLPTCLVLYKRVEHVKRLKNAIYIANMGYVLLFVVLSRASNSHYAYGAFGIEVVDELTLGYKNANETAIYLMLSYWIMIISLFDAKRWLMKLIRLACSGILGYMLWQTGSRICIILAVAATLLFLVRRFFTVKRALRTVIILMPLVTFLVVLLFHEKIETMTLMDEALDTGRFGLYQNFVSHLRVRNVAFGNGISGNLHNSYISVAATYGFPVAIMYIELLHSGLREIEKNNKVCRIYGAYLGVLMVIAHGVAEGTLLTAGAVYAGLAGLLFVLARPEEETE